MGDPHQRSQGHVLAVIAVADPVNDELLGNEPRDPGTQLVLDEVQHELERRDAARTGKAVAIDREQLIRDQDAREFFTQRREVLPVNRRLVAVEEPGLRERIAAGAERAEREFAIGAKAKKWMFRCNCLLW